MVLLSPITIHYVWATALWRGYWFYHFGKIKRMKCMSSHFFPRYKLTKVTLFVILRKISCQDDFFHTTVSFSVFHRHFQFVSFFFPESPQDRTGEDIESQQQHFEESVIICVERTWPIKHLLSNHESFVPNHVGP